ncbi:RecBCD enzyme subunit RecD [BD1-7 clade bacterium]|uniref:RecBCD enzyme subunit RecD n=1 Tax=BD1-7 clade bacterium TaxID=2029982 RepID=A0A5S9PQE7_9GAMM|nr:RecBCD enzyme subunit RecD [BD1-7 clade bacterium]
MSEQLSLMYESEPSAPSAASADSDKNERQSDALLLRDHPMAFRLAEYLVQQIETEAERTTLRLVVNALGAALQQGHVCLNLERVAGRAALRDFAIDTRLGDLDSTLAAVRGWPFVQDENGEMPIDAKAYLSLKGTRLYLARYADWEQRLAENLHNRSVDSKTQIQQTTAAERVEIALNDDAVDWQRAAVKNSGLSQLSIVVGGPGTGKTTTVARILASILEQEETANYRIGLAAPTGKAAARMAGSLAAKIEESDLPSDLKQCVPTTAQTLHRLLAWMPSTRRFRYHKENPLLLDCLVVDEVSMIDIGLFVALLEALPKHARLILLGDPFQLASVQAGNVLAELCQTDALANFSEARAGLLELPTSVISKTPYALMDNIVFLQKSWRFRDDAGIGRLASACLNGDWPAFEQGLCDSDVEFLDKQHVDAENTLVDALSEHHSDIASAADIHMAFERLSRFQLLCANREHEWSTGYFNQRMASRVARSGVKTVVIDEQLCYHGMPVMMQRNLAQQGLFNGDVGILFEEGGQLWLWFDSAEKGLIRFVPTQVRGWLSAHAITIHKSQGSEYDRVAIVLPQLDSPLQTRQLLYTAITRAKSAVTLLAALPELQKAVATPNQRYSGLRERLSALPV